jgi:hypothetical protein
MKSRLELYGFFLTTCTVLIAYGFLPFYQMISDEFFILIDSSKEGCAVVGYPDYEECPQSLKGSD